MDKTSIVFPGQGAQFVGMGRDLYDKYQVARNMFAKADEVFGEKISDICFNGPEETLKETLYQQVAIYTVSAIACAIWKERGEAVSCTAGLSLGEYTALYAAGVVTFEDGLKLVKKRAESMQKAAQNNPSGMLAVIGAEKKDLEALDGKDYYIANLNCPGQVVVSVAADKLQTVQEDLAAKGFKRVMPLAVSGGFHAPFMRDAEAELERAVLDTEFVDAKIPVICNVDAEAHTNASELKENLVRQLTGSVLWWKSVENMKAVGVGTFYEVGPGQVLKGILRKIDKGLNVKNYGKAEDFE
jgi:[acyl-carrier-protein] S-malonyltransferase